MSSILNTGRHLHFTAGEALLYIKLPPGAVSALILTAFGVTDLDFPLILY